MDKKRESFAFHRYYYDALSAMSSKARLELYDAICAYTFNGIEPTLKAKRAQVYFNLIKQSLDNDAKRSERASKGWMKRKSAHDGSSNAMNMSASPKTRCDDYALTEKSPAESTPKKKADIFADFAGGDKELLKSLREFAQMRTRIKKPMTDRAKQMLCNKLEKFDRHDWKAILDQSIYAGWQDIYALKQDDQYEQSTEMEFPRL